jgi:ornithine cyclodeaminase
VAEVLVISGSAVRSMVSMSECIEVMERTMKAVSHGQVELPLRSAMRLPGSTNRLGLMPGYMEDPKCLGAKIIALFPENPRHGYSSHSGAVLLFDPQTGQPMALINAAEVTALRTAAATAVATRALARPGPSTLCILGAGEQARVHLEAMKLIRPLKGVRIWNRSRERALYFKSEARHEFHIHIEIMSNVRDAVSDADIICTTTGATEPILEGAWIAEGTHLNLVGAGVKTASEVDTDTVTRSRFFVDFRSSALAQAGELNRAIEIGAITASHVVGEIGEVLNGTRIGRISPHDITVYKSLGLAAQDLALATVLIERARKDNLGSWVAF